MYRANLTIHFAIDNLRDAARRSVSYIFPEWDAWQRDAANLSDAELTEARAAAVKARDLADAKARDAASVRYAAECDAAVALRKLVDAELDAVKADNAASLAADRCCVLATEAGERATSIRRRLANLAA